MLQFELQKAADKLIREVFGVKPGETVLITADTLSDETLVRAVAASAYAAGAMPMTVTIAAPNGVGKAADPDIPVDALTGAILGADVWIEFNHQWLLYSTPFERAFAGNDRLRYMCLVDFDVELLVRLVGKVETGKLQTFMRRVTELHRTAKHMRVTTPAGTDVSFDLEPTHVLSCDDGDATAPGMHFMTGQLNVVPVFRSINGTIAFDGTITPPFARVPSQPVILHVEKGKILDITGGPEAAEYFNWLKAFEDDGMLRMAHIAYGFNPGAKLNGNIVEDERVWGCTEWGIGYVSPIDAPPDGQDAKSHTDGICLNSTVWLDDRLLMQDGRIVDPELAALDPTK